MEQTHPIIQKVSLEATVDNVDSEDKKSFNAVTQKSKKVVTKTESREANQLVEVEYLDKQQLDTTEQLENIIPEHVYTYKLILS